MAKFNVYRGGGMLTAFLARHGFKELLYKGIKKTEATLYAYYVNYIENLLRNRKIMRTYIDLSVLGIDYTIPIYVNVLDSTLSRELLLYRIREPLHTYVLFRYIRTKSPVILDIGSNIGYFPLISLAAGARKIICIEPIPINYAYLMLNLRENQHLGKNKILTINAAVTDTEEGRTEIYLPRLGSSKMYSWATLVPTSRSMTNVNFERLIVKAVSIDRLLKHFSPDFLRMDIEGYEWKLLCRSKHLDIIEHIDVEFHATLEHRLQLNKYITCTLDKLVKIYERAILIQDFPSPLSSFEYLLIKKTGINKAAEIITRMFNYEISVKEVDVKDFVKSVRNGTRSIYHVILTI